MKTEDEIRAEFEKIAKLPDFEQHYDLAREVDAEGYYAEYYVDFSARLGFETCKAYQALNNEVIAAKDAEIARLLENIYLISQICSDPETVKQIGLLLGIEPNNYPVHYGQTKALEQK